MTDQHCVNFLQTVAPRLQLRWSGFRKVRRQVCRRVDRRLKTLGLEQTSDYLSYLDQHPEEWDELAQLCRVTITRFYRDQGVFSRLSDEILPQLFVDRDSVRCWSAGCASGEEPYSLALAFFLGPCQGRGQLEIVATDIDPTVLRRARQACYPEGSLRELPDDWRERAFRTTPQGLRLREGYRGPVAFALSDIRKEAPKGPFDLVLCRNLAFTYFNEGLQREVLARISSVAPGGLLVIGSHEQLPQMTPFEGPHTYRLKNPSQ